MKVKWEEHLQKYKIRHLLNERKYDKSTIEFFLNSSLIRYDKQEGQFLIELRSGELSYTFTRIKDGLWFPEYNERVVFSEYIAEFFDVSNETGDFFENLLESFYKETR